MIIFLIHFLLSESLLHYISSDSCKLDSRGGNLSLPEIGAELEIPEDALPDETSSVDVSITLQQDSDDQQEFDDNQMMITPTVICEPAGMTFKNPVTLTLPHSEEDYQTITKEEIQLWYRSHQGIETCLAIISCCFILSLIFRLRCPLPVLFHGGT